MKTISIAKGWAIPVNKAVTGKLAFVGASGSGKSYGAGVLAEAFYEARAPFIIIDIVGNWWGLRITKDGKKPGIPIPIIGGDHGDIQITEHDGKQVAEALAAPGAWAIVDISDFSRAGQKRFITDFAIAFLAAKKRQPSAVFLIWEEIHEVCPQRVMGEDAKTVGAVERLVKRGRNYGVGAGLITQRVAAANKDILNQTEILLAFQTGAPLDKDAIAGWIAWNRIDAKEELQALEDLDPLKGECFVWAPKLLRGKTRKSLRIRIKQKWTFDSTATPEFGAKGTKAPTLAQIDLGKLKASMAQAIEIAKDRDPERLKARIRELEGKVHELEKRPEKKTIERIEVPMLKDKDIKRLEKLAQKLDEACQSVSAQVRTLQIHLERAARSSVATVPAAPLPQLRSPLFNRDDIAALHDRRGDHVQMAKNISEGRRPADNGDGTPTRPQQRILDVLAQFSALGVYRLPKATVAILAGASPTSGAFANNCGALRTKDLVSYPGGGDLELTPGGLRAASQVERPATLAAYHDAWRTQLSAPQQKIFNVLVQHYPTEIDREALAHTCEASPTSGAYANNLGRMRTLGAIDYRPKKRVVATKLLFPDGLR